MKRITYILALFLPLIGLSQENDFDGSNSHIEIQIEQSDSNQIWQIGPPLKPFFQSAFSFPNALVTDTLNTYPPNASASFIIEFDTWTMHGFPYLQLEWMQKTDMEAGVDGGIIEASYDGGNTWLNVFNDPVYRPVVVGTYQWDTLYNNQAGFSGKSEWNWVAICWGSYRGEVPNVNQNILMKFTFVSDTVDTKQEGWALDNFALLGGVIGSTSNLGSLKSIPVYPLPAQKSIFVNVKDIRTTEMKLVLYNSTGIQMFGQRIPMGNFNEIEVDVARFPSGIYHLLLKTNESAYHQKIIKIE